jgi:hypothetical protein
MLPLKYESFEGAGVLRDSAGALALACTLSAVAVTQDNAEWAKEAMLRAWAEHANSGGGVARSRVKVDYPSLQLSS